MIHLPIGHKIGSQNNRLAIRKLDLRECRTADIVFSLSAVAYYLPLNHFAATMFSKHFRYQMFQAPADKKKGRQPESLRPKEG